MKRSFFALSLFVAFTLNPVAGHAAPQAGSGPLPDRQVNARADPCVRLRAGASLDRRVLDCLEPGTRLRLMGAISGWSHVRLLDGTDGWLDSGYLEMAPQPPTPRPAAVTPTPGDQPSGPTGGLQERIEPELTAARARVGELEAALAAVEERLQRAAGQNAQQELRLENVDAALAAAKAQEAERQQELTTAQDRLRALESARSARLARIKQLEADLLAAQAQAAELRQTLSTTEAQRDAAVKARTLQASRVDELEAAPSTDLQEVRAQLQQAEAASSTALAAAEDRLRAAEQSQAEQARRIEELSGELARAESRAAEAELRARLADRAEPAQQLPPPSPVRVRAPIASGPEPSEVPMPSRVPVRMPAAVAEEAAEVEEPPVEAPVPATDAAINVVRAWAAAWSDQRVEDYLSYYARGFQPGDGLSRSDWQTQRQLRLIRPRFIRVTISSLRAELAGDGTVRATFYQEYESDTFADSVSKTLTLAAEDDTWRILGEQATNR